MIPILCWIIFSTWIVLKNPSSAPFVNPNYVPIFLWFLIIALAATLGLFTACLILRRERTPMPALVIITIQLFTLCICYVAYALGPFTSPVGIAMAAGLVGGSLIFDWRQVAWGVATGVVILAAASLAAHLGLIDYAPLIGGPMVVDGRLATWWITQITAPALLFTGLSVALFFNICAQWREREERLSVANAELTDSREQLVRANEGLRQREQLLTSANDELRAREEDLTRANEQLRDREEQLTAAFKDLRRSHARLAQFEKAVATAPVGITICDTGGRIIYTNRAEAEMHGYTIDEMIGRPAQILAPDGFSRSLDRDALKTSGAWRRESINVRKDGSRLPVQLVSDVIRDAKGEPIGLVTISEDITHRKEIENQLTKSEERYALAIRGASDGIWDWDIRSGECFFSGRWKAMLGYADSEIGTGLDEWMSRVHPEEREQVEHKLLAHQEGRTPQFECEYRILHKDGDYRWFLARGLAVRDNTGRATRMAGSQTDITERSLLDPLTGLPNRNLFMDRLRRAFDRAGRDQDRMVALLLLGLNRFNTVNESLGRKVGDQLLFMVAARLQQKLGTENTVARLGGDEFTILLEEIGSVDDARRIADEIIQDLMRPFKLYGREVFITGSIGIAAYDGSAERPEDLLRDADTALRRAKGSYNARHEIFDADMRRIAMNRFELESDLRRAVERGQLILNYQPIITMRNSRVAGFEALVRWNHPTRGLLPPMEFIQLAEESGQIGTIGMWVLREACRQMRQWFDRYGNDWPMTMNVNLSANQFNQPDLIIRIKEVLEQSGLNPRGLKLEITENVLMHDADSATLILTRLKELGLKLCMDDFGTGYSSLSYLNRFPFDTIKVDKSFVHRVGESEADVEIVRAMVLLAHNLGMDVVAEGIETQEQMLTLAECGCDSAQGFFYARPVDAEEAEKIFIARENRPSLETAALRDKPFDD